jgi:DNA polymerase-3 subunit alpha
MLDGACQVGPLIDKALEFGMPAVAMTDHGVMYGAIDFYKAAQKKGVKPIIGCEAYVTLGRRHDRKEEERFHLVLLAEDLVGYQNLMRLISLAHLEGFYYKPRIDLEILARYHKGLIGLSACVKGVVNWRLAQGDLEGAVQAAGEYREIFGKNNFFLEIQDHGLSEQKTVNRSIREVAARTGLSIVATNDVHYLRKEHSAAHEVLLCLQTQTVMSDPKRMRYGSDQFYMKTADEMLQALPEFPDAIDLTVAIAERCNVELEFGTPHFPQFNCPAGLTQKDLLVKYGREGVTRRYGVADPTHLKDAREKEVVDRFNSEIAIIERTGFVNYFLVVMDYVLFAKSHGIPVGPGRGSGGGSVVAYALGITGIDPLRYGLIFERFLNPERVSAPDFDIDFCQARRGEVIEYVRAKYGRENVAQIVTFGSLGAKTVVRDVGRALEVDLGKCDRLAKLIPNDPKMKLKLALEQNGEFKHAYETDPDCKRILDYGFVLEGLYRNPGTHAAGVVIGERPLIEIVPLSRDKFGETITQYAMEPLGEIGLLKMDFLGLQTLTTIHEAVGLVKELRGVDLDVDNLPLDDKPTYALLNRADTVGVFQVESEGMRDWLRRIKLDCIEDLIAMIALYRPGPMEWLPDYVDRKTGKAPLKYDHPLLEPILKETYGVMVYQEQVQKAANVLAGYSLGEADILRRAMGKKKKEEMESQRAKFVKGAHKVNHINEQLAGRIFDNISSFAGYGFNKSHSAGYAIIAYQTAYLKANYAAEYMAALISSEMGNSDKLPGFIAEAKEMGMDILPPDVNHSGVRFRPEGTSLRYGLGGIKNVGEGAAAAIVADLAKNGPYAGLTDFMCRLDTQAVNRKVVESLVRSGAMDSFEMHRARLFEGIDHAAGCASAMQKDRRSGQIGLFDAMESAPGGKPMETLPDRKPWPQSEMLAGEKELLSIYLSGHPLTQYEAILQRYQLSTVQKLQEFPERASTRVGGIVTAISKKTTKTKKEMMAFVTLESLDGALEVIVFPREYQTYSGLLQPEAALMVTGEVSRKESAVKLIVTEILPLADSPQRYSKRVSLHLPTKDLDDARLERVMEIVKKHPGEVPLSVCLLYPDGAKVFLDTADSFSVCPRNEFVHAVTHELGENSVYVEVDKTVTRRSNGNSNGGRR